MADFFITIFFDSFYIRLGADFYASLGDFLCDKAPDLIVKTPKYLVTTIQQLSVTAEAVKNTGELDGDIATPNNDNALWQRVHGEDVV